ncbi:MAG: TIGR02281 family clan AA aspartic protease [Methylococcales bacterium]|nr:TIGR02281 family clan AA aspartic protease [Methylococcales bacterium]
MQKAIIPFVYLLALALLSMSARGDTRIHKCKNQQGELIYQKLPCAANTETVKLWTAVIGARKSLVLEQGSGGHYYLDSEVNGKRVKFVVDTGASVVSLPSSVASAANIVCNSEKITLQTANGSILACTAVIPRLKFGSFLIKDVTAAIIPNLGQPLLGMNILKRFNIIQNDNKMKITEQDQ